MDRRHAAASALGLFMTLAVLGMHGVHPHGTLEGVLLTARSTEAAAHAPVEARFLRHDRGADRAAPHGSPHDDHRSATDLMTWCAAVVAAVATGAKLAPLVGRLTRELSRSLHQLLRSPDPPIPRLAPTIPV